MNSLEYIDLLIKSREEEVNRYTKVKNNLYFNESKAYYEKEMIGRINEQIKHLQQIKTELEAWEVVKPYVDIIDKYTPYPTWQLKPNYDKCKLNETNILIKALEVEDEETN